MCEEREGGVWEIGCCSGGWERLESGQTRGRGRSKGGGDRGVSKGGDHPRCRGAGITVAAGGGADNGDESLIACALLQQHPGSALAVALTTVLAGVAEDQEDADQTLCGDVWRDGPVLEALRAGCGIPGGDVAARRGARRAAHYRWEDTQLLRAMPGGRSRVCPPPDARRRLV
ncbi:hypothetical protein TSOC_011081 [Tetrabaena socialis]|uniref:Uncharacterized protein n=1 Tax=Tetrabaena socialis TaxID=47790 RepID=A0A2J7ZRK0_9CHLO|nr:hypothetical protein TSOC_011081 [Tetrabaena socialis]|eukprot:PNH02897.1 hypothetical protein TSOC_011081 [Tetrabaena socialis]